MPRRSDCNARPGLPEIRGQEDIDKARPGDFHFAGDPAEIEMSQYLLGQLSRCHAQFFSNCHHAISLIIAELDFCRLADLRFAIRIRTCGNERLTDFF
jgi:hypothetical protein